MAHFYGTLKGNRGGASRLGTKNSGLVVKAASWEGAVEVYLAHDTTTNTDVAHVALIPWYGAGTRKILYDGPVSGESEPDLDLLERTEYYENGVCTGVFTKRKPTPPDQLPIHDPKGPIPIPPRKN